MTEGAERPGTVESLRRAMASWRTASVTLLSFSSGLPLGLVWIAIPDWMREAGFDIRLVGLFTLAQAPWSFKVVWAPLLDRWAPPFWGRRRGWTAVAQVALLVLTAGLAGAGHRPETAWVVLAFAIAVALASATQDIAIDAYAVDVLRPEEHGVAVGARTAAYRMAMLAAGGLAIWLASLWSWPVVCVLLSAFYLPLLAVTWRAPEAAMPAGAPETLRQALWLPFLGFLSRHRAIEILAFVLLYKLADNLSQSLQRPFLRDMGYDALDRGLMLVVIGTTGTVVGTFVGGALSDKLGLGRSLWIFGVLQILSNLGFVAISQSPPNRPLMLGAMAFEALCTGLGMGAFSVLLLRLTQKRFSATQYALFSSVFGLPRILAGPVTGWTVHAVGWTAFFWGTMLAGIPGLLLLARFAPWSKRDLRFEVEDRTPARVVGRSTVILSGVAGGVTGLLVGFGAAVLLAAAEGRGEGIAPAVASALRPADIYGWILLAGTVVFAGACALFAAAAVAARGGASRLP